MYRRFWKRLFDVVLSACGLVVLSPVLLVVALLVRIKLGSPVMFRQARPGKDERIFQLYKFRTMTDQRDENGNLLPDELRLTRFGKILRSTSLDELPELWNILKGDMSLVGPRPLLVKYLPLYTPRQHRRHSVRPGLTGLAQVRGRNAVSWEERFELDVAYAEHVTLKTDLWILWKTVAIVCKRQGIQGENSATMEEFHGTKQVDHV